MKRVLTHRLGSLDDVVVSTGEDQPPQTGEVVLEMRSAVVSYVNTILLKGAYQMTPPLPFVPGTTGVGIVVALGESVEGWQIGQRVAVTRLSGGCLATRICVDAAQLASVPDSVSDVTAAGMLEAWVTMHFALTHRTTITRDERALVLGATGALGNAAVDILAAHGAKVLAVGTSSERLDLLRERDLDVLNSAERPLDEALRVGWSEGFDLVVDPVGGEGALTALKALAPWGRHLILGFASGDIPRFGANRLLIANRTAIGVDLGDVMTTDSALGRSLMSQTLQAAADGRYRLIGEPRVVPLDDVPDVLRELDGRRATGIVVARM